MLQYLVKALELGLEELALKDPSEMKSEQDLFWWKREPGDGYHDEEA